ncbi:hypothetical protein SLA2020_265960 [Shorea laevis]
MRGTTPRVGPPVAPQTSPSSHPSVLLEEEIKCDGCNTEEQLRGLIYHCSHCNFSLDIKCASLPLTIQAEIHQAHPLTLVRRSLCFTCDACGKEGKGMFYFCAICPFLVHLQCSSCHWLSNISVTGATLFTSPIPSASAQSIRPSTLPTLCSKGEHKLHGLLLLNL